MPKFLAGLNRLGALPRTIGLRSIVVMLICIMIAGTLALFGKLFFADAQVMTPPAPRPATAAPAQTQAPGAAAAPVAEAAAPVRTETITYDMWTVACRDTPDGKTKKVCSASLSMQVEQQNQRVTLGNWVIGHNNEGALISVLQTPQVDIGVLVGRGVELKLGDGKPRKINIVACNPRLCESTMALDDATIKEAVAGANGTAAVTFWKADGATFTINIASIKGIDKAIAAVR
jgi:invasion protein IalB